MKLTIRPVALPHTGIASWVCGPSGSHKKTIDHLSTDMITRNDKSRFDVSQRPEKNNTRYRMVSSTIGHCFKQLQYGGT